LEDGKIRILRTLKIRPDTEVNEPLVRFVDLKLHFNIILKEFKSKPFVSISNLFHKTQNNIIIKHKGIFPDVRPLPPVPYFPLLSILFR
jgi:hypothetical protein